MSAINSSPTEQQARGHHLHSSGPNSNQKRSVSPSRVSVGASRVHVHLLIPSTRWSHQGRSIIAPKSTRGFRAFITRRTQEGFDWRESDSRCETDGAAVAISTGSPDGIGVADRQTARATCRNGGTSAHRTERGSHAGGG